MSNPQYLLEFIALNAYNNKLNDHVFREVVKNSIKNEVNPEIFDRLEKKSKSEALKRTFGK